MHGRRQREAGALCSPWIFKHGTNIVDRGLKVLFFGLFSRWSPWKRQNSAIFGIFCYFRSFSVAPLPGKFSSDALDNMYYVLVVY